MAMTGDALPLGYAPHRQIQTAPDGVETRLSRFVNEAHAVELGAFLALLGTENRFAVTTETPVFPAFEGKL